jgi:glycerol-3-phosphate O-acyltransferase
VQFFLPIFFRIHEETIGKALQSYQQHSNEIETAGQKLQNLKKKIQRVSSMNVVKSSDTCLVMHWQIMRPYGSIKFLGNRPTMI